MSNWTELPIKISDYEYQGDWARRVWKDGTIADLLKVWDIDESPPCEMVQVLTHVRQLHQENQLLRELLSEVLMAGQVSTDFYARASGALAW